MQLSNSPLSQEPSNASSENLPLIMIVDDEVMVTTSLATLLRLETPYEVITYNDPQTALNDLAAKLPDLILSDFVMPGMDGLAFLAKAKEQLPEVTTVLLTGYADKESAIKAINSIGIYQYLEKTLE